MRPPLEAAVADFGEGALMACVGASDVDAREIFCVGGVIEGAVASDEEGLGGRGGGVCDGRPIVCSVPDGWRGGRGGIGGSVGWVTLNCCVCAVESTRGVEGFEGGVGGCDGGFGTEGAALPWARTRGMAAKHSGH